MWNNSTVVMYSKHIRFNPAHSNCVTERIIHPISAQFLSVTSTRHAFLLKKATNSSRRETDRLSAAERERGGHIAQISSFNLKKQNKKQQKNTTSFFSIDELFIKGKYKLAIFSVMVLLVKIYMYRLLIYSY